jgi:hypothetical protein
MKGVEPGVYRHNKSGKLYEVVGTALHTETDEELVIYRPLYESKHGLFARPLVMFTELVNINGQAMSRFEKVERPRTHVV